MGLGPVRWRRPKRVAGQVGEGWALAQNLAERARPRSTGRANELLVSEEQKQQQVQGDGSGYRRGEGGRRRTRQEARRPGGGNEAGDAGQGGGARHGAPGARGR